MKRFALLLFLLFFPAIACAQNFGLTNLNPPNTIAGATDMLLEVDGANFVSGATINWNGDAKLTTFVSSSVLTAMINTPQFAVPGAAQVTVTQGGVTSPAMIFQILTPLVAGTIYRPTVFTPGNDATISVTGQGFNPTATIFFDWFPVATTFLSSNSLSGFVTGGHIIGTGPHHVFVYNAPVPPGRPSLAVPLLVGFGQQTTTTTITQTITVTNISATTITLASPYRVLTGPNAADFAFVGGGTCANGGTLASGASCTAKYTYTPTVFDDELAVASILSNGTGSPQFVTLSGTGVPVQAPAAQITPSGLLFGNQVQSTPSSTITATLTNSGNASLTVSAISVIGTNSGDFAISGGTCTSSTVLTPGAKCSISVIFTPATTSTESAAISITDDAVGSPHLMPLSGRGVAAGTNNVVVAWSASPSSNLIGYNVYRGTTNGGPYSLLTPTPICAGAYVDTQVTHSTTYYYVITSLGTNPPYSPTESLNSTQVSATP